MNNSSPDNWWDTQVNGGAGSTQDFAQTLAIALSLQQIAEDCQMSETQRLEAARIYEIAIREIKRAVLYWDESFFQTLIDGMRALKEKDPVSSLNPRYFLYEAYRGYCKNGTPEPTKQEVIAKAKELWACARLKLYRSEITQAEIAAEIERLPTQNWTRHFKAIGLALPHAKPGPKKAREFLDK
jgi:hypothetical protein